MCKLDCTWETRDGDTIKVIDMSDEHLKNAIIYFEGLELMLDEIECLKTELYVRERIRSLTKQSQR